MAAMFGRAPSTFCLIFYYVVEFLDAKLEEFPYFYVDIITKNLDIYCNAIAAKEPRNIHRVWGVIDGTVRPICRPSTGQQVMYNGHKSVHAIKFQTLVTPGGVISHLFGPADGRRNDMFMLNESGSKYKLEGNPAFHNKLIYGEPAYGFTNVFCCPYKGCQRAPKITQQRDECDPSVREMVIWRGEKVLLDFGLKKHQRVTTTPTATLYNIDIFFTNCVTSARGGNNNSRYFRCKPPMFEEYFASYPNTN